MINSIWPEAIHNIAPKCRFSIIFICIYLSSLFLASFSIASFINLHAISLRYKCSPLSSQSCYSLWLRVQSINRLICPLNALRKCVPSHGNMIKITWSLCRFVFIYYISRPLFCKVSPDYMAILLIVYSCGRAINFWCGKPSPHTGDYSNGLAYNFLLMCTLHTK